MSEFPSSVWKPIAETRAFRIEELQTKVREQEARIEELEAALGEVVLRALEGGR